jgi:hypothetical protein
VKEKLGIVDESGEIDPKTWDATPELNLDEESQTTGDLLDR